MTVEQLVRNYLEVDDSTFVLIINNRAKIQFYRYQLLESDYRLNNVTGYTIRLSPAAKNFVFEIFITDLDI